MEACKTEWHSLYLFCIKVIQLQYEIINYKIVRL